MAIELPSCPRLATHQLILEQVLVNEIIVPSLPKYYPCPHEAKAHLLIKTFSNFFVMYSSTSNVNVFKVSNPFHVYKQ
jgi:hypothetical protein